MCAMFRILIVEVPSEIKDRTLVYTLKWGFCDLIFIIWRRDINLAVKAFFLGLSKYVTWQKTWSVTPSTLERLENDSKSSQNL